MLQVIAEDASECCKRDFTKKVEAGGLDSTDVMFCRKCGCEYRARVVGEIRSWEYFAAVLVFRR